MKNKANVEEKEKEDKDKKEGTDTCIIMLPGLFTLEFPVFLIDIYVKIYLASYNLLVIDEYQVNKLINESNLPTDFHVKCIFHLYYLNWKVLFETRNWW